MSHLTLPPSLRAAPPPPPPQTPDYIIPGPTPIASTGACGYFPLLQENNVPLHALPEQIQDIDRGLAAEVLAAPMRLLLISRVLDW